MTHDRSRHLATVGQGGAQLTDAQIAAVLNQRHGTTRNNRKNVSFLRCKAEKQLKAALGEWFVWLLEQRETR
jgi:hypothetical protein